MQHMHMDAVEGAYDQQSRVEFDVKYDCLQVDLKLQSDTYFSSLATEVNSLATATSNASKPSDTLI